MTSAIQDLLDAEAVEQEELEAQRIIAQVEEVEALGNLMPSTQGKEGPDFTPGIDREQMMPEIGPRFVPGASEAAAEEREEAKTFLTDYMDGQQESLALKGSVLQGLGDTAVGLLGMAEKLALRGQPGVVEQYVKPFWDRHNPQSDNGAHHAVRQISGVVLPSLIVPGAVTARLAAAPWAQALPGTVKTTGAVLARLGLDTAIVAASSSADDENAAKALNDAFGWNIPWATREGAGPDERRKYQLYENMGFAAAGELVQGLFALKAYYKDFPKENKFAASWIHEHNVKRWELAKAGTKKGEKVEWDPGLVLTPKTDEAAEALTRNADAIAEQAKSPALRAIDEQIEQLGLLDELGEVEELRLAELVTERAKIEVDEMAFDPLTRNLDEAAKVRNNSLAEEASERAVTNQGEYDPMLHKPAEDQAVAAVTTGPADPLGAGYDYVRIANDMNTTKGAARAALPTSGMRKLLNAPEGSARADLYDEVTQAISAHKGMDALIEGKWKVSSDEWKAAVDAKVAEIHNLSTAEMTQTLEDLKRTALKGADFLPTEEFLVYSEATKQVMELLTPNQLRASAMVVQQAADNAASAAKAKTVLDEVLETSRQTDNMLQNLGLVLKETRAVRYLWGYTGNLLDMTKGRRFNAEKLLEIVGGFEEGLSKAHQEASDFVQELKRVAIEEPELWNAFTRAYDLTEGSVDDISKLNRWAEESVSLTKLLYNRNPKVKSLVVQGIHGVRYNSYLNGLAPIRAALGNSILTINKPISIFAGSAFQAATGNFTSANAVFKRALFTYGGVVENFQRALKHMGKEWDFAVANPEQAMLRGRQDIKFAQSDQLDVVESMAAQWEKEGKLGHLALLNMAKVTSWYNNLSINRWGVNALHAIDGFTNSMMASGSARTRAYDELFKETGGVVDDVFEARFAQKQQQLYDQAFDSTGLLTDDAAKHASREIALNLDSETAKRMENMIELYPFLKPLFMFPRTGINGLKVAWSYNPLSALPDAIGKGNKVFNATTPSEVIDVLRLHGITDFSDPNLALQTLKNEYRGRQMMGSAIVMGVGLMAANGDLTGNGPFEASEKQDMMRLGWKPNSIRINGEWYSYKGFEPFQQILSMVADVAYNANRVDSSISEDRLQKIMYAISMNVTNQTFLSGMKPLVGLISRDETTLKRFIAGWTDPLMPFAWSGTRSILNKTITPQLKDVENEIGAFHQNFSKFLFNSNDELKDQLDVYTGERINYNDLPTAAINAVLPFFKSNGGIEPWRQWLIYTGWNNLNTLRTNRLNGKPLNSDERYFINNWVARYGGLKEKVIKLMKEDMKGGYTERYRADRGDQTQAEYPIKNTYIHDQLDKIHNQAFKEAWEALENENLSYRSMGVLEKYKQQQLESGDTRGAVETQDEIDQLLSTVQEIN